jgi:NitT/TauT family transport system substrate-binding protein
MKGTPMISYLIAAVASLTLAGPALAQSQIRFALEGPLTGADAAYVVAVDNGHFAKEGLTVVLVPQESPRDVLSRVAVGNQNIGVSDFGKLAEYTNDNPGARIITVMITHDAPAHAVVALKKSGIAAPTDIIGRIVGHVDDSESASRMRNFDYANDVPERSYTLKNSTAATLAQKLANGDVDAVVGFSHQILPDLMALGISEDDVVVMRMLDYGLLLYGEAIVVNMDFAQEGSGTIQKFLKAIVSAWRDVAADPAAAAAAVVARDPSLDLALETARVEMILRENVLTDWAMQYGLSEVNYGRMEGSIAQLIEDASFIDNPEREQFWDPRYLPSPKDRALK